MTIVHVYLTDDLLWCYSPSLLQTLLTGSRTTKVRGLIFYVKKIVLVCITGVVQNPSAVPDLFLMVSFRIVSACLLNWSTCSRLTCWGGDSRCHRCLLRSSSLSIKDRRRGRTSRGRWSLPLRTCILERGVRTVQWCSILLWMCFVTKSHQNKFVSLVFSTCGFALNHANHLEVARRWQSCIELYLFLSIPIAKAIAYMYR